MKEQFDVAMKKSLEPLAAMLGANMGVNLLNGDAKVQRPGAQLTEAERRSVLGGESDGKGYLQGKEGSSQHQPSLHALAAKLKSGGFRKVVVLSGAGISVNAGIPDFRSEGSGLYHNLSQYHLPRPESIFEIGYFRTNPKPFFTLAKELYPGPFKPSLAHAFVALLEQKGLLLRNYTQNIDCLERIAGVSPARLVEAHGSFARARCVQCREEMAPDKVREDIMNDVIPLCKCGNVVKPAITFFGEDLPPRYKDLHKGDLNSADLIITMGSSLTVNPFAQLPNRARDTAARLLINRDEVGDFDFGVEGNYRDVFRPGDVDEGVMELANLCGWERELSKLHEEISRRKLQPWEVDERLRDYSPGAQEAISRDLESLIKDKRVTTVQGGAYRNYVKESDPELVKAYHAYMNDGFSMEEGWLNTLEGLVKVCVSKTSTKAATAASKRNMKQLRTTACTAASNPRAASGGKPEAVATANASKHAKLTDCQ